MAYDISFDIQQKVKSILAGYRADAPHLTASALREYWVTLEHNQGIQLIKAEQRAQHETAGISIPALKSIGEEIVKVARKDVAGLLPLAQMLWEHYGREGRVAALILLGAIELLQPEKIVPMLRVMCRECVSWEDADRLAMDALEPVLRKHPEQWLEPIAAWLDDDSKWVRRAAITIIGRLPMKHPGYVPQCLQYTDQLLYDDELDVKRAVSFAIRICAKSEPARVREYLEQRIPPPKPEATWVLCDVIKSMGSKQLPEFAPLLAKYQAWEATPGLSSVDRRSIQSAIKMLQTVQ